MTESAEPRITERRGVAAWCVYDWANSPFPAIVLTFVIPAYFADAVVGDAARATTQWAVITGVAALAIALASPLLGAIADQGRRRKPWLGFFTVIMAAGSLALWFVHPRPDDGWLLLALVGVTVVAFELSMVFYNALLPSLVSGAWLGRISGWAWGLGYFGGAAACFWCCSASCSPPRRRSASTGRRTGSRTFASPGPSSPPGSSSSACRSSSGRPTRAAAGWRRARRSARAWRSW
jgi:MFS-type transporter involved in bile tolerance (Atg22 family)